MRYMEAGSARLHHACWACWTRVKLGERYDVVRNRYGDEVGIYHERCRESLEELLAVLRAHAERKQQEAEAAAAEAEQAEAEKPKRVRKRKEVAA